MVTRNQKTFLVTITKGANPPLAMMSKELKEASFSYTTDKTTAKALGIPTEGQMDFRLVSCIESTALTNIFIVKGASKCGHFIMEGTYYPGKEWGKLYLCKVR